MYQLRLAFRHLQKRPLFSFINILGLIISITGALLMGQYIFDEQQTDSFIPASERTYRLLRVSAMNDIPYDIGVTSAPFKSALEVDFSADVEEVVRFRPNNGAVLRVGQDFYAEETVRIVDNNFMSFFGLSMLHGDQQYALQEPHTAVLTEATATKMFGGVKQAIGQTFQVQGNEALVTVKGVAAAPPVNSHLSYDVLLSMSSYQQSAWMTEWWWNSMSTYIRLQSSADAENVEARFPAFMDKYFGDDFVATNTRIDLKLEPIQDTYFAADTRYDFVRHGQQNMMWAFGIVVLLLLGIATANYLNLTTARAYERLKTLAVMRTIGADKRQIRQQLLLEGVLVSGIAGIAATVLYTGLQPLFVDFFQLANNTAWSWPMAMGVSLTIALLVSVLTGGLPAIYLSRMRLNRSLQQGSNSKGRLVMVTSQFALSIALICVTILVQRQLGFVLDKPLGFSKDDTVLFYANNDEVFDHRNRLAELLEAEASISSVSVASGEPGGFHDATSLDVEGLDHPLRHRTLFVDSKYLEQYEIGIVAGRNFIAHRSSDSTQAALVNERALLEFGLTAEQALGRTVEISMFDSIPKRIIGVVSDYHFASLHGAIEPMVITQATWPGLFAVKVETGRSEEALQVIQKHWAALSPSYPLSTAWLTDEWANLYTEEVQQSRLLNLFAYLSIFVSCLGIFGLSVFAADRRKKELSIRKVLGAQVSNLVALLVREFLQPIGIGLLVAIPLAWYAMQRWLSGFIYHVDISLDIFLIAGLLALFLGLTTVSFQSIRAALHNPVDNLRND